MRLGLGFAIGACVLGLASACSDDDDGTDSPLPGGQGATTGAAAVSGAGVGGSSGTGGATTTAGGGGSSGTAGAAASGSGGSGGTAGTAGDGGESGAGTGGDEDDGGVDECVYDGPIIVDPADSESCETSTCQNAHCLSRDFVSPEQAEQLSDCDADNECVPDLLIVTVGQFLLPTCRSIRRRRGALRVDLRAARGRAARRAAAGRVRGRRALRAVLRSDHR